MKLAACLSLLVLLLGTVGCRSDGEAPREVVVFAAASLREAAEEIAEAFEEETGEAVLFNFAGSNVLARQILATAHADVFLSASERWMDSVAVAGRLVAESRQTLLSNSLVVVAHPRSGFSMAAPCELAALPFKYLALADPAAVPAGTYARAWLAAQRCGPATLWDAVAPRVAPAPDVRAALLLVLADPALVAIVYRTDLRAYPDQLELLFAVAPADGPTIRYAVAQTTEAPNPAGARRFAAFLSGPAAKTIFERHGFDFLPSASDPDAEPSPGDAPVARDP